MGHDVFWSNFNNNLFELYQDEILKPLQQQPFLTVSGRNFKASSTTTFLNYTGTTVQFMVSVLLTRYEVRIIIILNTIDNNYTTDDVTQNYFIVFDDLIRTIRFQKHEKQFDVQVVGSAQVWRVSYSQFF